MRTLQSDRASTDASKRNRAYRMRFIRVRSANVFHLVATTLLCSKQLN